jgi:hypothetical protein
MLFTKTEGPQNPIFNLSTGSLVSKGLYFQIIFNIPHFFKKQGAPYRGASIQLTTETPRYLHQTSFWPRFAAAPRKFAAAPRVPAAAPWGRDRPQRECLVPNSLTPVLITPNCQAFSCGLLRPCCDLLRPHRRRLVGLRFSD